MSHCVLFDGGDEHHVVETVPRRWRVFVGRHGHASFRAANIAAVVQFDLAHLARRKRLSHWLREAAKHLHAKPHDEVAGSDCDNDIDDRSHQLRLLVCLVIPGRGVVLKPPAGYVPSSGLASSERRQESCSGTCGCEV